MQDAAEFFSMRIELPFVHVAVPDRVVRVARRKVTQPAGAFRPEDRGLGWTSVLAKDALRRRCQPLPTCRMRPGGPSNDAGRRPRRGQRLRGDLTGAPYYP